MEAGVDMLAALPVHVDTLPSFVNSSAEIGALLLPVISILLKLPRVVDIVTGPTKLLPLEILVSHLMVTPSLVKVVTSGLACRSVNVHVTVTVCAHAPVVIARSATSVNRYLLNVIIIFICLMVRILFSFIARGDYPACQLYVAVGSTILSVVII